MGIQAGGVPARAAAPRRRALGTVPGRSRAHRPHRQGPRPGRRVAGAGTPAAGGVRAPRGRHARLMAGRTLIALYGGTFDPVHNGHLAIARTAATALGCRVRLMPAADPPHRPPPGASAHQRASMLDLAVEGDDLLCVDRREMQRDGPSYTVQTLRDLRAAEPDTPVALLVGADSFLGLPAWREWEALF